jgi:hypothetical protein
VAVYQEEQLVETITYSQVRDLVLQLPEERLSAYQALRELIDRGQFLQAQIDFMHLPLVERCKILAIQAEQLRVSCEANDDELSKWQAGDFVDEIDYRGHRDRVLNDLA